jgi:uncharacterized protein CbrC (UPF0167 family)
MGSDQPLPAFRYYPDPVAGESIAPSAEPCSACERVRGYLVTSVAYGAEVPDEARFCPWCVADGSAYRRFGAFFNEVDAPLGAVPAAAREEVERHTPGFDTWQDWGWPVHCGDVMAYLGQPRAGELRRHPDAWSAIRENIRQWEWGKDEDAAAEFIDGLDPEGGTVAYLFRCLHCGAHTAVWDQD